VVVIFFDVSPRHHRPGACSLIIQQYACYPVAPQRGDIQIFVPSREDQEQKKVTDLFLKYNDNLIKPMEGQYAKEGKSNIEGYGASHCAAQTTT